MSDTKALPSGEPQKNEIEFGGDGVKLGTAEDAWRFAKRCFDSGMLPEQINNANQAFVILCKGAELGLPAFASWSYVYLTKARRLALTTKGALAVVQAKPTFDGYREWIEGEGPQTKACAMAKRKGFPPMVKEFSMQDAEVAGLLKRKRSYKSGEEYDGPWQSFMKDMLLSRARGRVLDLVFAAELGGIPVEGVAEDTDMMEARRIGSEGTSLRRVHESPALPEASSDPLLALLEAGAGAESPSLSAQAMPSRPVPAGPPPQPQTQEDVLDPSLVKVIEEQVEEMWPRPDQSGPPPAAQPEPATPDPVSPVPHSLKPPGPGAGSGGGNPPPIGKVAAAMGLPSLCQRCNTKLNAMGGCDFCGWPGPDMR